MEVVEERKLRMNNPGRPKPLLMRLFGDSLVTGLPQIVSAPTLTRRILKIVVLLVCLCGFVYQTTVFLRIFWSYPTVLDTRVEYPESIRSPAITFCNLNGIKRTPFCRNNMDKCQNPKDSTQFCLHNPVFCKNNSNLMFPKTEFRNLEKNPNSDYLRLFGHSSNDTLRYCNQILRRGGTWTANVCRRNHTIHTIMSDGIDRFSNCYTLFSSIGNQMPFEDYFLSVPKIKRYLMNLYFFEEAQEYFLPHRETGVAVALHSPDTLVNPFAEGFVMKPSHFYTVQVKLIQQRLLPNPYDTKCQDYKSEWLDRGMKGPLDQQMCVAECIYNASMRLCNCVVQNLIYSHNDRYCEEDELDSCFFFNVSECYTHCRQPCELIDFEYDVKERKLDSSDIDVNEAGSKNVDGSLLVIFLKRPERTLFSYRPQYEDIEVFSFVGGYMGMWLGVSLVAVADFLESLGSAFIILFRRKFL